jgi:hypothetical protein
MPILLYEDIYRVMREGLSETWIDQHAAEQTERGKTYEVRRS